MGVRCRVKLPPTPRFLAFGALLCALFAPSQALPESVTPSPRTTDTVPKPGAATVARSPAVGSALARGRVYTLQQLLDLAEANYPKVREAQARLRVKK